MFSNLNQISMLFIFFLTIILSLFSSLILLQSKIPLSFVRVHIWIITLPPLIGLVALFMNMESEILGPWHLDSLSWLLSFFVLTVGLIVQRFSVHYLLGDLHYRTYFVLMTMITITCTLAWFSHDLRLLFVFWGLTLLGLVLLIGLKKEWQIAKKTAVLAGKYFLLSLVALFLAIVWLKVETGSWELSHILSEYNLTQMDSIEKTCINLLLILSVIIPAAQWPFGKWLLNSIVTPTPVSAIMHAGIVNAGGMILTRFSPLFSGDVVQIILLVFSSLSVLVGTGIMLVQVDYKRKLVGSTIAQMGFMLIQCALGAYGAAITHAVLHGLFKSTLFLQAGSAIRSNEPVLKVSKPSTFHVFVSFSLGFLTGIVFWLSSPEMTYQFISAVILGWSVTVAWQQIAAFESGRRGLFSGGFMLIVVGVMFIFVHHMFHNLLHDLVQIQNQPPKYFAFFLFVVLLSASGLGIWLSNNRSSRLFAIVYLWLVQLGEPQNDLVESHPKYIDNSARQGGH